MSYPRFQRARSFRKILYTGGDITLNATAITDVHASALDMTLEAQVGDELEYSINAILSNVAQTKGFDVYTIVSAARVNPFSVGLSASLASLQGVPSWQCHSSQGAAVYGFAGSITRTVVSGDIDANGRVTARLAYAGDTTTARTLYAGANVPLFVTMKNLGPQDPE